MNIYFACSITGGREFESIYGGLVAALLADGHEIPTAHLARSDALDAERAQSARDVFTRDVMWIEACDAVIAEVSIPSHGVGFEIAYALQAGKPVICLYQNTRKLSKMISGNPHPALEVHPYTDLADAVGRARTSLTALARS